MRKLFASILGAFAIVCLAANETNSHTNSIGYVGEGAGTVVFWYGSWHSNTNFNEGSLQLVGSNGTNYGPVVTPFNLFSSTLPNGLVAGINFFQSNGTSLVPYGQAQTVSYVYQGVRFTSLQPGQYTFTYIPLGHQLSYAPNSTPTLDWQPQDNVILSSTVSLTAAIISPPGTPPTTPPAPTVPVYTGPGAFDTSLSLIGLAYSQTAAFMFAQNNLFVALSNYDCTKFTVNDVCVAIISRSSFMTDYDESFAGTVAAAWRPIEYLRIGAWIEQTVSNPSSHGINVRSAEPTWGVFAVAEENRDGSGFKIRTAYTRSSNNLRITRDSIGTSEPGNGRSAMTSEGYGAELSYGIPIEQFTVSPYVGFWRMTSTRNGYTEDSTSAYPITYNAYSLTQNVVTAGVRTSVKLADNLTAIVGAGVEKNINNSSSDITGTSNIPGLGAFAITMPRLSESIRPVGSLAIGYDIDDSQSVVGQVVARRLPEHENSNIKNDLSVNVMIRYQVAF